MTRWTLILASSIRMICDYFFPKVGGVESHIYSLAEALCKLGHKVRTQFRVFALDTERESDRSLL